jgi:methylmalonyl-CoA mutase cobalamin-binding domain/chain
MTESLIHALVEMQEQEALQKARQLLDEGTEPMKILGACSEAMESVGERFEANEYFLPQLMLAGEMVTQISEMIKPEMKGEAGSAGSDSLGKVLMGTVKGDIHDIGKNIVCFMLEVNGFEVRDIGIDVTPGKFVEAIKEFEPQVVGMSCLLTLGYDSMKETVQAIKDAGLRDEIKIMIGGAQVSEKIREYAGADAHGEDAIAAVRLVKKWRGAE